MRERVRKNALILSMNDMDARILTLVWAGEHGGDLISRADQQWIVRTDDEFVEGGAKASRRAIRKGLKRLREKMLIETMRGAHPNGCARNSRYLRLEPAVREVLESRLCFTLNAPRSRPVMSNPDVEPT